MATGALFTSGYHLVPTALHPPLYPLALAALDRVGVTTPRDLLWLGVVTGTITVSGLGRLGRSVAGTAAGVAAGHALGYFDARCAPGRLPGNEAQQAAALRRRGLNYARRHVGRLALVVLAGVGLAALLRAQPSPSGSRQPMSPGSSSAACGPHEPCS